MPTKGFSTVTRVVVLMALYFLGGLLGRQFAFDSGKLALVWPPSGIALAAILAFGAKYWPGVAAGAVMYSLASGQLSPWFIAGTAIGNSIGALVCAYLLEKFVQFHRSLRRVRDVAGLVAFACVVGTTVNATFNVVGLCFAEELDWDDLFPHVIRWWVPNAMGILVVTPLLISWSDRRREQLNFRRTIEACLCAGGLLGGTLLSFQSWYFHGIANYPFAYLPYPFLVWSALRFGPRGATAGTLLVAAVAIHSLLEGRGPFVMPSEQDSLMLIGSYIGVLAVSNLLLAALAAERSQAEAAIAASERRYRAIVEDQSDLIWRFTPDGRLTFVNEAYCRFHGKSREELLGSFYLPLVPEEDREIPLSYFNSLPPSNPVVSYDYRITLPDGKVVWQECTTRRLFDAQGNTSEFQSVAQDVTRRKETEEEIRQAEQRLRAIVNSMVDGLVVIDAEDRITMFNPAAERVFGRIAPTVLGTSAIHLFDAEDEPIAATRVEHLAAGATGPIEALAVRPDGSRVPIDLAVSQFELGRQPFLIAIVRDISERRQLEEQVRQSQKMEAIGRLAGGIAHDFNNLIQAIIGYTILLNSRTPATDPNRETLEQIEKAADRAAALTGQLLAFSRKQVLKPKLLSPARVVDGMVQLLQRLIGETVHLQTRSLASGCVRADPSQLEQVILNLSLNSRDAMPDGGTLSIETDEVLLSAPLDGFSSDFQPGPYVVLSVSDTGCGMTSEQMSHLFEPFFTTKEVGKGTGLGLSIVYGIVTQSGGEITVSSLPGRGTTFRIYLPRVAAEPDPEPVPSGDLPETPGGETILLVEDGDLVRMMLVEVLQEHSYRVIEAADGEEALRRASTYGGEIDLLITDLVMPQISGRSLADRLLASRPQLKVLFISGYTDDEVVRLGKLDATTGFLQKPFRPDALLARVREMLEPAAPVPG